MGKYLAAFAAFLLAGCAGAALKGVEPIKGFDVTRYLGTWYEIARLDHRFERGLTGVTAEYSLRPDGGLRVLNRGYSPEKKKWKEAEGKAYFRGPADTGALKVSFFWFFYGDYNVIDLAGDYSWALVAGPGRGYLWILARTPELPAATVEQLKEKARALGFPADELIFPGRPAPAP